MATLEPRLLPFIEMLAELGLDWLAFELIDGVQRGDEPVEDEFALARAQEESRQPPTREVEHLAPADAGPTPFLGDDQLQWAVEYVFERLQATLAEMAHSLNALDQIVGSADGKQAAPYSPDPILLLLDDEQRVVRRAQVETARGRLSALREALEAWRVDAQTEPGE